ncbi:Swi5-domain-containing protein [Aspergillus floccosus]
MPTSQDPPPTSSPAENGNAQREKRLNALHTSIAELESQIEQVESQIASTKSQLKDDPAATVQRHIRLLHDYNEIKDIGQGLMGLIADARGMRQIDVQKEFGVGERD